MTARTAGSSTSAVTTGSAHRVTRYTDRVRMPENGPSARLFGRYKRLSNGRVGTCRRRGPHAYERWDNGVPIPEVARRIYGDLGSGPTGSAIRSQPGRASYFAWLNETANGDRRLTNFWAGVYARRPDVQKAFRSPGRGHRAIPCVGTALGRGRARDSSRAPPLGRADVRQAQGSRRLVPKRRAIGPGVFVGAVKSTTDRGSVM